MSDYGYDSDEFDLYDDDGWLYIAEEDHLADDLAERAVVSPPPRDYDIDGSGYNSDYYEYWVDIEYNSDGWNDVKRPTKANASKQKQPGPKKRKKVTQGGSSQKKRKGADGRQLSASAEEHGDKLPTVLWQSRADRIKQQFQGPQIMSEEPKESFALLGDWRTRFGQDGKDNKGKTASVEEEDDASNNAAIDLKTPAEAEGSASPPDDQDDLEHLISGSGLDPQALIRALQENLAASGAAPAGLDQSTLLKYALRMLNGEGEADDIAGELADDLFERAEGDDPEGKEIGEWASKQKGQPENDDTQESGKEDDERSEPEPKNKAVLPPTPPTTHPCSEDTSASKRKTKGKDSKASDTVSVAAGTRKRKASEPEPDEAPPPTRPKRATRSYAAPTATSRAKAASSKGGRGKRG